MRYSNVNPVSSKFETASLPSPDMRLLGLRDQPLQYSIQIGLLFGTDAVAANLAVGYRFQLESFDELVHRELFWKV